MSSSCDVGIAPVASVASVSLVSLSVSAMVHTHWDGAALRERARELGKTPVEVNDYPGFVANRVLMPMINEAAFCLMEGVASAVPAWWQSAQ